MNTCISVFWLLHWGCVAGSHGSCVLVLLGETDRWRRLIQKYRICSDWAWTSHSTKCVAKTQLHPFYLRIIAFSLLEEVACTVYSSPIRWKNGGPHNAVLQLRGSTRIRMLRSNIARSLHSTYFVNNFHNSDLIKSYSFSDHILAHSISASSGKKVRS